MTHRDRLLTAIQERGTLTVKEAYRVMEFSTSTPRTLSWLVREGYARRIRHGVYAPATLAEKEE